MLPRKTSARIAVSKTGGRAEVPQAVRSEPDFGVFQTIPDIEFGDSSHRVNALMRRRLHSILLLSTMLQLHLTVLAQRDFSDKQQDIQNSSGVVVLSKNYGKQDFIKIYNEDDSLWYEFTFYYDDRKGQFPYSNNNFKPFAFHPDHFLLALKCVGKSKNRYEVIVNEETGLRKYVHFSDTSFSFETWGQHIQKVFSVDISRSKSPLLRTRRGARVNLPEDVFLHPVKVEGDWLMVKWVRRERTRTEKQQYAFGWVKWRDQKRLLIELFYFA